MYVFSCMSVVLRCSTAYSWHQLVCNSPSHMLCMHIYTSILYYTTLYYTILHYTLQVTGKDYSNAVLRISKRDMLKLPVVTFVLQGGVGIAVKPEAYMEPNGSKESDGYMPRIYLDEGSGAVIGANVMRDHDVLFDRHNKRYTSLKCWRTMLIL